MYLLIFAPIFSETFVFPSDKAKITSSVPGELTVEAGHQFSVDFDIQGDPTPSITWNYNGGPLEGRAVEVMAEDGKARLVIRRVTIRCSGFYELLVENQGGKDIKDFYLKVIGKKT